MDCVLYSTAQICILLSSIMLFYICSENLYFNERGVLYFYLEGLASLLLMLWLLMSPGHLQPWYWLCRLTHWPLKDLNKILGNQSKWWLINLLWNQAITWINADLSFVRFSGIHLEWVPHPLFCIRSLKSIRLTLLWHLQGTNESMKLGVREQDKMRLQINASC